MRKAIESAGAPCSSASDRPNTRTRYDRRPRRLRPRKLSFRKPSSTLIALRICMTARALRNPISIRLAPNTTPARKQLKSARALTSEAEIALRDTSLIAPFDGDIVKKAVELGAFVGPGVPAFALAKTDIVKIVIGVPDTVVRSVELGQPVDVAIDAFAQRTFQARISRISSAADTMTRNFEVEVAIPNRDHLLKVGMIGSLQFARNATAQGSSRPALGDRSVVQRTGNMACSSSRTRVPEKSLASVP